MRKLWGILFLIVVCNIASLATRVAALEPTKVAIAQYYIDEQEEDANLDSRPDSFALQQSENFSECLSQTNSTKHHSSKDTASSHNHLHNMAEHQQWLCQKAYIAHHTAGESHNQRATDYYIYALRHIII
ncbi:MAG: hypothetical protein J6Q29_01840 [Alistipes sp.]|nr:hypothetical protein [Alistipes sp.]